MSGVSATPNLLRSHVKDGGEGVVGVLLPTYIPDYGTLIVSFYTFG